MRVVNSEGEKWVTVTLDIHKFEGREYSCYVSIVVYKYEHDLTLSKLPWTGIKLSSIRQTSLDLT